MKGKWADCATVTENGTISVQQVFESWPGMRYMVRFSSIFGRLLLGCEDDRLKSRGYLLTQEPVLLEVIQNIARIANGGWGQ